MSSTLIPLLFLLFGYPEIYVVPDCVAIALDEDAHLSYYYVFA